MNSEPIKILIADDHPVVIDGLQFLLSQIENYKIVATAFDGQSAIESILKFRPDIAIIDIGLPKLTGIQVIQRARRIVETKFIVLSMHTQLLYIKNAKQSGASAYLTKNTANTNLLKTIESVLDGQFIFPNEINEVDQKKIHLTDREINVGRLMIKGLQNTEIADMLGISHHTVATHRKNIFRKCKLNSPIEFAQFAEENGINLGA